jgi:hypothetical protein
MSNQIQSCGQRCFLGPLSEIESDTIRHYERNHAKGGGGDADQGLQELTVHPIEGTEPQSLKI